MMHKSASWLPAIVIAILPKCPFCIMAYSGAVSLCSGSTLYPNSDSLSSYITIIIACIVLASLAFNYKGKKTKFALLFAALGIACITASQFIFMNQALYYLGVGVLFFGIWFNGSFQFFYNRYFKKINSLTNKKLKFIK